MPPRSSARLWEIDALRGLLLVLMTLTHLPTRLTSPLGQPLGFVSAADGFVLLSACMAGMVYGRPSRAADGWIAVLSRAFRIYGCHAVTLLFLFTAVVSVGLDQPAVSNLVSFYLQDPVAALAGALLLIYKPALLDILPLYVLFMLVTPWVLGLARRCGWTPLMGASVLLWLLAQFGLSQWSYDATAAWLPILVPYRETGAFSIWAWQFLWMMGLWMGVQRNEPQGRAFDFPRWALVLAAGIALTGLVWRHTVGQAPFGAQEAFNLLFDKWQLGPMRLINLFALVALTLRFGPALARRLPRLRWLETLGAASLPVFCAHLMVVLLVLGLLGDDQERPWTLDFPLLAASLGTLYAVARVSLWLKRAQTVSLPYPAGEAAVSST